MRLSKSIFALLAIFASSVYATTPNHAQLEAAKANIYAGNFVEAVQSGSQESIELCGMSIEDFVGRCMNKPDRYIDVAKVMTALAWSNYGVGIIGWVDRILKRDLPVFIHNVKALPAGPQKDEILAQLSWATIHTSVDDKMGINRITDFFGSSRMIQKLLESLDSLNNNPRTFNRFAGFLEICSEIKRDNRSNNFGTSLALWREAVTEEGLRNLFLSYEDTVEWRVRLIQYLESMIESPKCPALVAAAYQGLPCGTDLLPQLKRIMRRWRDSEIAKIVRFSYFRGTPKTRYNAFMTVAKGHDGLEAPKVHGFEDVFDNSGLCDFIDILEPQYQDWPLVQIEAFENALNCQRN